MLHAVGMLFGYWCCRAVLHLGIDRCPLASGAGLLCIYSFVLVWLGVGDYVVLLCSVIAAFVGLGMSHVVAVLQTCADVLPCLVLCSDFFVFCCFLLLVCGRCTLF